MILDKAVIIVEMKRRMLILLLLAMLLLSSGCNSVATNRAKWEAAGIRSYRMKVAIQKPGHRTPMGTYLITVADGKAVEILSGPSSNSGEAVEPKGLVTDRRYPINFGGYETIEDYLKIVEKESGAIGTFMMNVRFDPTYGYPSYLHFEGSGLDDGINLEVLKFTKLSENQTL